MDILKMENTTQTKYELVIDYVLSNIKNGLYRPHQMIESENELSDKLNVSRVTVRKGLEELVNSKVLNKKKGIGTFVNPLPKYFGFKSGVGFSSEAKKRGLKPSTELLSLEKLQADEAISEALQVPVDSPIWKVERIRYANNIAICYELEYFDANIVKEIPEEVSKSSIYEYLSSLGITYEYVDQKITAVNANKKLATYLDIQENSALIHMEISACLSNGKPFNIGNSYYQTDSFYLVQTIYK
jgi:DNA-binding GntR family transcriptional regulator